MKKILIPYDFSPEAEYALDAAVQFDKIEPCEIHIVHVVEVPSSYLSLFPEYGSIGVDGIYSDEIIRSVEDKLDKVKAEISGLGISVKSSTLYGKPFQSIQNAIIAEEADLIIMGSKGATGLKEIFVGSNAERIIRCAKVPVLTLKQKIDLEEISDLVYATDFSIDNSLKFVKQIQKLLYLKIKLLKVFNSNDWTYTKRTALEKTEEFGIDSMLRNYSVHVIDSPFVTDGILQFAHEKKADLIVMGTHGYTGIGHLIAGSNAEGVANHSKIPIFTVHK
ncbi:MAG: universal stress protein [Cyclobacteriaceae bacterium]